MPGPQAVSPLDNNEAITRAVKRLAAATAKPATLPKMHWYELDWVVKYRDLVLVLGGGLVITGIAMIYKPAGFIVAGTGMIFLAWHILRPAK